MRDTDRPVIISLILDMHQHVFIKFSNQYISISRKQAGIFLAMIPGEAKEATVSAQAPHFCLGTADGGNAEENTYIAVLGEQSFVEEFII